MDKQNFNVTISGRIGGYIWMPTVLCWKDFDYKVKKDETLRDAILHITNDGDFQSCNIADGSLEVTYWKANKRITRFFNLRLFPSIADCLMQEDSNDYIEVMYPEYDEV